MAQKTTIMDVAKYAEVSVTTVSLALSGKGRISAKTIEKINEAIVQLGYVRNKNAATLRSGRSEVVGVVLKDITDPFYANIINGIDDILSKQKHTIFLAQSGLDNHSLFNAINSFIEQDVSGIILCDGGQIANEVKILTDKQNIPLVIAAQSSSLDNLPIVRADNRLSAQLATQHLVNRGHRKIAYLGGKMNSLTRAERLAGFGDVLSKYGLTFKPEWIITDENHELNAYDGLLKQHPDLSAFLCHDASTALSLFFSASKLGRTFGKGGLTSYLESQIDIFSFTYHSNMHALKKLISYVDNQPYEIGRQAAHYLLQNNYIDFPIIIQPKLIV